MECVPKEFHFFSHLLNLLPLKSDIQQYSKLFKNIRKFTKIFENLKFLIARESKITFSKCQVLNMSSGLSRFSVFVVGWLSYRLFSFYRGLEMAIR